MIDPKIKGIQVGIDDAEAIGALIRQQQELNGYTVPIFVSVTKLYELYGESSKIFSEMFIENMMRH